MQQSENAITAVATEDHGDLVLSRLEVQKALGQLPEKSQQILLMMADGYKYEEIAEEMHLSVKGLQGRKAASGAKDGKRD